MTVSLACEIPQRCGEPLLMVALANAVQTIPSLAIFGLLLTVPVFGGIGPTPAVVALFLYAMLPLLRGLVTGLVQVPPGLKEAGPALGLSRGQLMRQVEFPLALPSLMAGLQVATIDAAIGAAGLGVFIFRGIATVNNTQLLAGALPAAALAIPVACRWLGPTGGAMVVVGAKSYTEQLLLGELLAQEIEANTPLRVKREFSLGSTFLLHEAVR